MKHHVASKLFVPPGPVDGASFTPTRSVPMAGGNGLLLGVTVFQFAGSLGGVAIGIQEGNDNQNWTSNEVDLILPSGPGYYEIAITGISSTYVRVGCVAVETGGAIIAADLDIQDL